MREMNLLEDNFLALYDCPAYEILRSLSTRSLNIDGGRALVFDGRSKNKGEQEGR
jgi:hypothetical protein